MTRSECCPVALSIVRSARPWRVRPCDAPAGDAIHPPTPPQSLRGETSTKLASFHWTPTELRRCCAALLPLLVGVPSRARSPNSHKQNTRRGVTRLGLADSHDALCGRCAAVVLGVSRDNHRRGADHHDDDLKPDRHTLTRPRAHPAIPIRYPAQGRLTSSVDKYRRDAKRFESFVPRRQSPRSWSRRDEAQSALASRSIQERARPRAGLFVLPSCRVDGRYITVTQEMTNQM